MQILGSIPNADVGKVSVIMSVMSRLTVSQQLADIWLKVGVGQLLLYSSQLPKLQQKVAVWENFVHIL